MMTKTVFILLVPVVVVGILTCALVRMARKNQPKLASADSGRFDPTEALSEIFEV